MASRSAPTDELGRAWEERPDVIRGFIEIRLQYEQLCSEVAYILTKRMNGLEIEYSAITSRAKTLKSFAEKLGRKRYDNPLNDITDLAGVRLVYLYKSDLPVIQEAIESEFEVVEKLDKIEEQEADRFGYGALHYLVHLGRKSSGARYDDLRGMICEIQVRTVLQDAWAIIDHHLVYKQEADIPKILKRKLNSLSGLFETADDQFDRVRAEREQYKETVKGKLSSRDNFLDQDVNLDTFVEFLKLKFPNMKIARSDLHLSAALAYAIDYDYKRLLDLDTLIEKTKKARDAINSDKPIVYGASNVQIAIGLYHPDIAEQKKWEQSWIALIEKHKGLVPEEKSQK